MNSHERINKVAKFIKAHPPLIIAHNCGYDGYGVPPYSREATKEAYKDCDYLEIDLILKNDNGKKTWWYFHQGLYGEDKSFEDKSGEYDNDEDRNRRYGISLDRFLKDFQIAEKESESMQSAHKMNLKPGIFLDLKKHLNQDEVNNLMEYLNNNYQEGKIPEGTPLMIFTGRGWIPHFHAVYRHTTRYFLKWLADADEESFLNKGLCPKLTLVTREIDVHKLAGGKGILEPFRKSKLNPDELQWFNDNLNEKLGWGFNPYTFWLNKYFRKHFKKDYGVFENGITLIPWFTHFLPWFSKLLPVSKLEDEAAGWKNVIETIDEKYWLYLEKYNKAGETPKSVYWGIITYEPNELIDFLKKESFQ